MAFFPLILSTLSSASSQISYQTNCHDLFDYLYNYFIS